LQVVGYELMEIAMMAGRIGVNENFRCSFNAVKEVMAHLFRDSVCFRQRKIWINFNV
jgi:hypothetical protein